MVFWDYSGEFSLSYKYDLEVDGEQRELDNTVLYLNFNDCIGSISKPVITNIEGSITFVNSNNENVKCEYSENRRHIEVDGKGRENEVTNKELFELYPLKKPHE